MRPRRPSCRATARSLRCARPRSERFDAQGLPHRRVEEWKYTDLRALMRDAKPLAAPPDAAAKARAKDAGRAARRHRRAPHRVRRRRVRAGTVRPRKPGAGPDASARWREALAAGDPLVATHLGKVVPTDDDGVSRSTPRFMGDGAVIHVAAGAAVERPIHLVFAATGDKPAVGVHPLAGRDREGRARHADRKPRGRGGATIRSTPRSSSSSATTPMSITSRSPREGDERAARLVADGGDRRARALQRLHASRPAARWCATSCSCASTARARVAEHPRREPAQGHAARRHHAGRRPRGRRLPEPRGVQDGARRREPRRVPGQDHRAAAARRRPTPR